VLFSHALDSLEFKRKIVTNVRFEVLRAMSMKNIVFWDVKPCRYGDHGGIIFL
jgi:hypothetical protein